MTIRFDNRVAIVTGAGNGIGRSHAMALAALGAKVVVNDFGGARDGSGGSASPAEKVVAEIKAKGGEAMPNGANVAKFEDVEQMVAEAKKKWGRVDILVNNAGILRDKTFGKMELADFRSVLEVHLMGSVNCTKAVWDSMREQNYGRVVFTTSSSGLYGNFGQANYGAAKAAMVGFMNVLHHEGQKFDIRLNTISPTAATRMTEELMPANVLALMQPDAITPAVLYLVSEKAPSRTIMGAGAGVYAVVRIMETEGVYFPPEDRTPDAIAAKFEAIADMKNAKALEGAFQQTQKYVEMAAKAAGIDLSKK
jgi:NAD(P)-dependent dehydrogenase (short-subunit alcohol dehydrogenase family)